MGQRKCLSIIGIAYNWTYPDSFSRFVAVWKLRRYGSLPKGRNAAALKAEIEKQFGLVAHKETRDTDVLLLKVGDPAKLLSHASNGGNASAI